MFYIYNNIKDREELKKNYEILFILYNNEGFQTYVAEFKAIFMYLSVLNSYSRVLSLTNFFNLLKSLKNESILRAN